MPWNGTGSFSRDNGFNTGATVWAQDEAGAVAIESGRHDTHDQDLSDGIDNCLAKDGQNAMTAALNHGGYKGTNLAAGTASTDAARIGQLIPAGTQMVFYQASAPTGWTSIAVNDHALKVVSAGGAGGTTGGVNNFSAAFNSNVTSSSSGSHSHSSNTGYYTLQIADIPAHNHPGSTNTTGSHTHSEKRSNASTLMATGSPAYFNVGEASGTTGSAGSHSHTVTTNNTGGGGGHRHTISSDGAHTHTHNVDVKYANVILCSKDVY